MPQHAWSSENHIFCNEFQWFSFFDTKTSSEKTVNKWPQNTEKIDLKTSEIELPLKQNDRLWKNTFFANNKNAEKMSKNMMSSFLPEPCFLPWIRTIVTLKKSVF